MHTITKTAFVAALAKKQRRAQSYYTEALHDILEEFTAQLSAGHAIRLTGFGTLKIQHKRERTQRHIRTGEPITIPAHTSVHFQVGDVLKARLHGKPAKTRK